MKNKPRLIKIACIAIFYLLVSVIFTPSFYAEIDNQPVQTISDDNTFDYDSRYNPVQLVFLLIHKLLNHEQIQTVDSVDDVEQLVEGDVELSGIFEELMSSSCGCEDSSSLDWNFPVICFLLCIPLAFCLLFNVFTWELFDINLFGHIIDFIGESLNCPWADFWVVNTNST